MKLTLERNVAASLLFAGGIFLLMAGGSIYSIRQMTMTADWVAHTEAVVSKIHLVLAQVVDMESGVRSYVITGQEEYLAPLTAARAQLNQQLEELHQLVADNPGQSKRWAALKPLVDQRLEIMTSIVNARRMQGADKAMSMVGTGQPHEVTLAIRNLVGQMLAEENRLLEERRQANTEQANQSIEAAIATAVMGFLVLGFAGWVIVRQFHVGKQAREELAESRAELQGIVDNAPVGIFLKDLQSRYIMLNGPMKNLLGAEPSTCLHKAPAELFSAERAKTVIDEDRGVLTAQRPQEIELEILCPDGVKRIFHTVKFPLHDAHGRVYALGGISSDITEQKRMEVAIRQALAAAENASRTKSQFLANMSHELRTPLNSIIGFSEILSDQLFGPLNDKQQQYLKNILSSGRHLLLLINDLLDLAKIEAGRMNLDPERVSAAGLLQDAASLARGMAERKGVALDVHPADPVLFARLDAGKAKQIIYNLLSNAIKFTPHGGQVTLKAERVVEPPNPRGAHTGESLPGEWLRLTVTDTGIGIAEENLERIFIEFEQVDNSYSRQEQGTGLGLSLTRGLAELHGGYVWAESPGRVNQGSIFYVLLPVAGPQGAPAPQPPTVPPKSMPVGKRATGGAAPPSPATMRNGKPLVLIVEDDPHARDLMANHLTSGGYEVAYAETGEDALRLAAESQPAAITLDIVLPDANGMDILARLKATQATRHIPVIIVTVTDDRQLGLSLGAAEFFIKPVGADKLLAALARVRATTQREIEHVLVVDDESAARDSITAILEPKGYKLRTAASGDEALRLIAGEMPDVAIIDLTMPGMSGFELVQRLREDPATRQLPICIYTAKDLSAAELRWLREQAAAITPKPFREQLLAELQRFCANTS